MPPRSQHADDVRHTADAQAGLITAAQLAAIGVHSATTSRRAVGGMWTRVLPGVHLVDGGHPSRQQREVAALLYAGEGSMLTGLTALRHYGIRAVRLQEVADDRPERPEPVHVLIPHDRRRLSTGYVRIERTHRLPPDPVRRDGLDLARLPRAVGDAARRSRRATDVEALVSEVVQRRLVTVSELVIELASGSRRGGALFRDAVGAVAGGARSAPEADLARLLESARVPHVLYNATLVTGSGRYVATCDAWLDDVGLAIEVDSAAHHASPDGFGRTLRRNTRYATAGVLVVGVLPADLRDRPSGVLQDIRAARSTAAARPRPDVVVSHHESPSSGRPGWRWGA
ncbi:MAG TPA: hypothetical protein VLV82_05765 [Candidatus Angelobacter sp.]|nr:hypothetical protein [Candidatus Angelobacter sp.]